MPFMVKRPWTLWIFCLIIALLGVYNLLLALDQVRRADEYNELGLSYPPPLRAGCALVWGIALLGTAWHLAQRRRHARRWTFVILSNYGLFGVLWLLIYARSDYSRGRILFQVFITLLLLLIAAGVMRWPRVRRAFSDPRFASNPGDIFDEQDRTLKPDAS